MEENSAAYEAGYKVGEAIGGLIGCALLVLIPALFVLSLIMAIVKRKVGWVISTVIFGLIGLGIIGATVYFGMKEAGGIGSSSGEYQEMVTSDDLATIEVPSYWKKLSLGNEESSLDAGNMFRVELMIILSESREDFATGTTLTEYSEIVLDQMIDAMEESAEPSLSSLEIGGRPALETPLEAVIDKVKLTYLVTFVEGEGHFHQIISWTTPSKREKAFPTFRKVAASFREKSAAE